MITKSTLIWVEGVVHVRTPSTGLVRGHNVTFTLPHLMHTWSPYCARCMCDFNTPPRCAACRALQRIRRRCCQREIGGSKELWTLWVLYPDDWATRLLKVMYSALMDKCTMISCALSLVQLVDCLQVWPGRNLSASGSGIMFHKFHVHQGIVASG